MVSTDVRRPAAIQQLSVVGEKAEVKVYAPETMDPVARASGALSEAGPKGSTRSLSTQPAVFTSTTT